MEESVSVLGQYYMLLSGSEYYKNKSYLSQNGVVLQLLTVHKESTVNSGQKLF